MGSVIILLNNIPSDYDSKKQLLAKVMKGLHEAIKQT